MFGSGVRAETGWGDRGDGGESRRDRGHVSRGPLSKLKTTKTLSAHKILAFSLQPSTRFRIVRHTLVSISAPRTAHSTNFKGRSYITLTPLTMAVLAPSAPGQTMGVRVQRR